MVSPRSTSEYNHTFLYKLQNKDWLFKFLFWNQNSQNYNLDIAKMKNLSLLAKKQNPSTEIFHRHFFDPIGFRNKFCKKISDSFYSQEKSI